MHTNVATDLAEPPPTHSNYAKNFYALLVIFLALLVIFGTLAKDEGLLGDVYVPYWEVLRNIIWGTIFVLNVQLSRNTPSFSDKWRKRAVAFFGIFAAAAYAIAASDFMLLV